MGILGKLPCFLNPWLGSALTIVLFLWQHYRTRGMHGSTSEREVVVTALQAEKKWNLRAKSTGDNMDV